jgi:hypothetical protein
MLSGGFPYGTQVPKSRTRAAQKKLAYQSVLARNAKSRLGRRRHPQGRPPDPFAALRGNLRVHLRPAPPEQGFPEQDPAAADRAPSGDFLEERVVRADAGFDRGQRGALSLNQPVWRPEGKCYGRPEKRAKIKMAAVGASQPASQRRRNKARSD